MPRKPKQTTKRPSHPPARTSKPTNSRVDNIPSLPRGWPEDITYLTAPSLTALLPSQIPSLHKSPPPSAFIHPQPTTPSPLVRIQRITTPAHPAYPSHGLFTTRHLPPSTLILTYLGAYHPDALSDPTSDYDIVLSRDLDICIDAQAMGNEARFINDYRGVSDGPNAEFRDVWIRAGEGIERRVGVWVLSAGRSGKRGGGIAAGGEVLVSYGKGFWRERAGGDDGVGGVALGGEVVVNQATYQEQELRQAAPSSTSIH